MAFTAGIKRPQAQANTGNYQQSKFDRIGTVLKYDVEKKTMYFLEDETNKKYEVIVNHDSFLRGEQSLANKKLDVSGIKWMGHNINAKMAKAIPEGQKVILKKSVVLKKDNGEGYARTEVERIKGVPNAEPDKAFSGIITVTYNVDEKGRKRVSRVQHWAENGVDVNDDAGIEALKKQIADMNSQYGKKIGEFNVTLPTVGVKLVALMKTDRVRETDNTPVYEAVETSIPFDWISGESEDGEKIPGHPLEPTELVNFIDGFIEHISNKEEFKEHLDNMKIEVHPFKSYPASQNDQLLLTSGIPEKDVNADKNPLYQMAHKVSYSDIEHSPDGKMQGKNWAVKGIVQISPNKAEKIKGTLTEIPSYWVTDVHANHIRGNVLAFIRTSEGYKVEPHASLKVLDLDGEKRNDTSYAKKAEGNQGSQKPKEQVSEQSTPATTTSADLGEDDEFDPFKATPTNQSSASSAPVAQPAKLKFGSGKK